MLNFPPISGGAPPQANDVWPHPASPGIPQWRWDGVKWISVDGVVGWIISAPTPPAPAPNILWFDSVHGGLFFSYDDGDSIQWISITGKTGPQGEQGLQGIPGPVGGTFPATHASAVLPSHLGLPASFITILSIDVGNEGIWFVTATLTYSHAVRPSHGGLRLSAGSATFNAAVVITGSAGWVTSGTISSIVANPTGPIAFQAISDGAYDGGQALATSNFASNVTSMTAFRIG